MKQSCNLNLWFIGIHISQVYFSYYSFWDFQYSFWPLFGHKSTPETVSTVTDGFSPCFWAVLLVLQYQYLPAPLYSAGTQANQEELGRDQVWTAAIGYGRPDWEGWVGNPWWSMEFCCLVPISLVFPKPLARLGARWHASLHQEPGRWGHCVVDCKREGCAGYQLVSYRQGPFVAFSYPWVRCPDFWLIKEPVLIHMSRVRQSSW